MFNKTLPVLPLRDILLYPEMTTDLTVGRLTSIKAIDKAIEMAGLMNEPRIILVTQKDATVADVNFNKDVYMTGTIAEIVHTTVRQDGSGIGNRVIELYVTDRVKINEFVDKKTHTEATYTVLKNVGVTKPVETAMLSSLKANFVNLVKSSSDINFEASMGVTDIEDLSMLIDTIAIVLKLNVSDKLKVLEDLDLKSRATFVLTKLKEKLEVVEAQEKLEKSVSQSLNKSQKEYYLREQMEAIQKELGEGEEDEMTELTKKIESKQLSKEAREKVTKELKKLKKLQPMSAESGVIRNYLDQVTSLPWNEYSQDNLDIKQAEKILDRDSYGMNKTKERVLEQLAIMQMSKGTKSPIICLYGSPGVGKTSIAKSIADALGKQFTRISLGGVRDESEIRGHRRTYVGAMPGKIITSLKKMSTANPVILLDEIDKMTSDQRGDPAAAMLEVLDPAQNSTFVDHFLDMEFDLSKVTFICTANDLSKVPRPLLDRMELIKVDSYITAEKLEIAKRHLIPKQLKEFNLEQYKITFTDKAVTEIIEHYTKEAGVRSLERTLATVLRKVAKNILKSKTKVTAVKIDSEAVIKLLDEHKYKHGETEKTNEVGLTNGMAWTEVGGDLLQVEVVTSPGKGAMTITGSLGDVMKESCSTAFTVVKTLSNKYKIPKSFFTENDIHIHFPDGATPKDGPSAGITIVTSMISAITKRPVKRDVAMTGEVSIRGKVMPIGGLKEKVIAAHRGGIKTIVCPEENKKDLKDIPKEILKDLKVVTASQIETVLKTALS